MCIARVYEEIFPFGIYIKNAMHLRKRCKCRDILREEMFVEFETLASDLLSLRLEEERQRASALDEKTFKLTLSLSVGLTVLGSTAAFFAKGVWADIVVAVIGIGVFFVLGAGFVALGALRTLPSYGYGTQFLLRKSENEQIILADALARQETMNQMRHLRNETSFQALRNGLLLIFAGIALFFSTEVFESTGTIRTDSACQSEKAAE